MRIISGKWGGRRLATFKSPSIRPTTDRVKETIFNMIGPDIEGAVVLDLFCGTGNLGLEALSRGAAQVTAVDKGRDSREVVRKNLSLLKVESKVYKYVSQDVFSFLNSNKERFDFVFVDPPFTQKLGDKVLSTLENVDFLKERAWIFVEYVKGEEIFGGGLKLKLKKRKNYGDKLMCLYEVQEGSAKES